MGIFMRRMHDPVFGSGSGYIVIAGDAYNATEKTNLRIRTMCSLWWIRVPHCEGIGCIYCGFTGWAHPKSKCD